MIVFQGEWRIRSADLFIPLGILPVVPNAGLSFFVPRCVPIRRGTRVVGGSAQAVEGVLFLLTPPVQEPYAVFFSDPLGLVFFSCSCSGVDLPTVLQSPPEFDRSDSTTLFGVGP